MGNLDVNLLFDDQEKNGKTETIVARNRESNVGVGGNISGVHGVGISKRGFILLYVAMDSRALMTLL